MRHTLTHTHTHARARPFTTRATLVTRCTMHPHTADTCVPHPNSFTCLCAHPIRAAAVAHTPTPARRSKRPAVTPLSARSTPGKTPEHSTRPVSGVHTPTSARSQQSMQSTPSEATDSPHVELLPSPASDTTPRNGSRGSSSRQGEHPCASQCVHVHTTLQLCTLSHWYNVRTHATDSAICMGAACDTKRMRVCAQRHGLLPLK